MRLRDDLGRFIKSIFSNDTSETKEEQSVSIVEQTTPEQTTSDTPVILRTNVATEISINGKPIDLTCLTKEEAVTLFNFNILNKEHFNAICRLEGWSFAELAQEVDDEDESEDEDDEY